MDYDSLMDVAKDLGLTGMQESGEEHIKLKCVYSEYRHKNGYDRRPSATISHSTGVSWFICFTCGTRKPLHEVITDMVAWRPGTGLPAIAAKAKVLDSLGQKKRIIAPYSDNNYGSQLIDLLKNEFSSEAIELLKEKGVDPDYAKKHFKVCFMPKGYVAEGMKEPARFDTIFFPVMIRTTDRRLQCIGGQARPLGGYTKYFSPFKGRMRGHMYGEHRTKELAGEPVFVEEGMLDVIHTCQVGHNALGSMGTSFCGADAALLRRLMPSRILIFMDPDNAGETGRDRIADSLSSEAMPYTLCDHDKDPKHCGSGVFESFLELP